MDIKKIIKQTKEKVDNFLQDESTKEAISQVKKVTEKVHDGFNKACDKADIKLKAFLSKDKEQENPIQDEIEANTIIEEHKEVEAKEVEAKEVEAKEEIVEETEVKEIDEATKVEQKENQ